MSDRDSKRKSGKVRFDNGSSRGSTVGGSSTSSSGHSGSQYTTHYNVNALEETVRATVAEMDAWKKKACDTTKTLEETKAHAKALELSKERTDDENADLRKANQDLTDKYESLKKDYARLARKLEKLEQHSPPSSPDSSKLPRRSDSKRASSSPKDTDHPDTHNARLKARFERTGDTSPSEGSSSKPPSSSKAPPHSSSSSSSRSGARRQSFSSTPVEYRVVPAAMPHHQQMAPAGYASQPMYATAVPRSPGVPVSVPYPAYGGGSVYGSAFPPESGHYQAFPLPR